MLYNNLHSFKMNGFNDFSKRKNKKRKKHGKKLKHQPNTSVDQANDKSKEKRKPVPQPAGAKSGKFPEQPCAMIYCGLSKSGKSTLLAKTLTDKTQLGNYFHTIVLLSPTANSDSTITSKVKMPPENIITDFTEEKLKDILDGQRKLIKKEGYNKVAKTNRMLLILDDCISHQKFLKSKTIIDLTATVRHLLISVVFLIQSYKMVTRACRINMRGIAFFQSNRNETNVLVDEESHPSLKNRQFRDLIHYATNDKYSFLFINKDKPFDLRYSKKYDQTLRVL